MKSVVLILDNVIFVEESIKFCLCSTAKENWLSSLKWISLIEDTFLSCTSLMIWAAIVFAGASMVDLSRWIVGSSRCKSKLKLVKIDMAHSVNSKADSKSGFENQSFKRRNHSSLKSSLTKYKRKLGTFLRIRTKQHSNENHRTDRCLSTGWYSWSQNSKYSTSLPLCFVLLSN